MSFSPLITAPAEADRLYVDILYKSHKYGMYVVRAAFVFDRLRRHRMYCAARYRKARSRHGSALNEFGPALFIFFFFALFPMLNLVGVAIGFTTVQMIAQQTATAAAASTSYSQGLTAMQTTANNLQATGFAKFAKLVPVGGFSSCGCDLYVARTDITSQAITSFGPNTPMPAPIDSTKYIYEYQVKATYQILPFVNMSGVPFIGAVPGLGAPASVQYAGSRAVEYPDGLISLSAP
jgi:hypothetical protein